jgi:hypothetical protein
MKREEHVVLMGEVRNAFITTILVEKPDGNKPLGRSRRRWDDIRMDLGEIGWEDKEWIHLA